MTEKKFEFPKRLKTILITLKARYSLKEELSIYEQIISNATPELITGDSYDNLDGGTYYHKLVLYIPSKIYMFLGSSANDYENQIQKDINDVAKISGEWIAPLSILVRETDALTTGEFSVDDSMWGKGFRIFISHRVEEKREATELKKTLEKIGFSAFVAHEDIEPTKEWLNVIENALLTMDAFVALLTKGYSEKVWTNQEVGFAYCLHKIKSIPFVTIRNGEDPKGFFASFQSYCVENNKLASYLFDKWKNDPRMIDSLIESLNRVDSYDDAWKCFQRLSKVSIMTGKQIERVTQIFNDNSQVNKCYKIIENIAECLNKWSKAKNLYSLFKNSKGINQVKRNS
jgi:hypothetical protein